MIQFVALGRPSNILLSRASGRMNRLTTMPKTNMALTLDVGLVEQIDELVERRRCLQSQ